MAFKTTQTLDIIEGMENFLSRRRPPEEIRDKIDFSYKIDKQSVIILELRPRWDQPEIIMEIEIAKATFVQTRDCWSVYWKRSDLKWHSYGPNPTVKTLAAFIRLVEEDKHHAFWG